MKDKNITYFCAYCSVPTKVEVVKHKSWGPRVGENRNGKK